MNIYERLKRNVKNGYLAVYRFITVSLWSIKAHSPHSVYSVLLKFIRIFLSSIFKFHKDEGFIRVGALTYYTINSLVPLLALMLWVTARFAVKKDFAAILININPQQEELINKIYEFSENMINSLSNSVIFFVGLGFLLWSVFSIMSSIENTINTVWSIHRQRGIGKKLLINFSTVLLLPFIILISVSLNVLMRSFILDIFTTLNMVDTAEKLLGLQLLSVALSFIIIVGLFSVIYFIFPNRKIKYKSALVGAIVAAVLFMLFEKFYVQSQIGVSRANSIFGSFAAIPLFLIWLYISWTIIIYGAYISYHTETYPAFTPWQEEKISIRKLKRLAAGIYTMIETEGSKSTLRAIHINEISKHFVTSSEQLNRAITYLLDAKLIKRYAPQTYCLAKLNASYSHEEIHAKIENLYASEVTLIVRNPNKNKKTLAN